MLDFDASLVSHFMLFGISSALTLIRRQAAAEARSATVAAAATAAVPVPAAPGARPSSITWAEVAARAYRPAVGSSSSRPVPASVDTADDGSEDPAEDEIKAALEGNDGFDPTWPSTLRGGPKLLPAELSKQKVRWWWNQVAR